MPFSKHFLVTISCVVLILQVNAQVSKYNAKLAQVIDSLAKADQLGASLDNSDSAAATFQRAIHSNFPVVSSILDKYGFPGYDLVGKKGSDDYWMLVQHSDFDVPFQKRALVLMQKEVQRKNASGQYYAYLTDRIRLNEGGMQVYGTQVIMGQGGTHLRPCADTTTLDTRRKSVGLEPIRVYLNRCDSIFQEINKDRLKN